MVIQLITQETSRANLKEFDSGNNSKNSGNNSRMFPSNKSLTKIPAIEDKTLEAIYTEIFNQSNIDPNDNTFKSEQVSIVSNVLNVQYKNSNLNIEYFLIFIITLFLHILIL